MKRCPMCDRTYDDSQSFCVNDGATLTSDQSQAAYDPLKTIVSAPPPQSAPLQPPTGYGSGDLPGGQAPASWQQTPPPQANAGWAPPPAPQPMGMPAQNIQNYLVPAIISTICCCLPAGVVSIIFATQVNSKLKLGDIQGAMDASAKAKMWFIIAVVAGAIVNILAVILQLAAR